MILLGRLERNCLGFFVVLFILLYFDTDVSDERIISILKVSELCVMLFTLASIKL